MKTKTIYQYYFHDYVIRHNKSIIILVLVTGQLTNDEGNVLPSIHVLLFYPRKK